MSLLTSAQLLMLFLGLTGEYDITINHEIVRIRHRKSLDRFTYRHDGTPKGTLRALRRAVRGEHGDDVEDEIRQGTRL